MQTKRADERTSFRSTLQLYFALFKHVISLPFQHKIELCNPQQVLREKLGDDLEVLDFTTDKLVKFGDNYGSTIVKATIDIKYDGRTERLNLVAKMLPPFEFVRKNMQCDVIMAKEIFLYEEIIPFYQKFGGNDFDIAPKFYGGRLTTNPEENVMDDGAVLLLENLKETGYVMEERLKGLTLDHLRIAIPALAKFHAIGLAIKQKNPEFYLKIKDHAKPFDVPPELLNIFIRKLMKLIKNNRELSKYYEHVKSLGRFDSNGNHLLLEEIDPEHPYACLVHRDLWINNMMFHKNEDKIDGCKFFDFQIYGISSPITDLLYFLLTSLPREYGDFNEATELYRKSMCDSLKELHCDSSLFEDEAFQMRLKEDAQSQLYRGLIMARNIEVRSAWDMMRISADSVRRIKGILGLYDSKGWLES